MVWGDPRPLIHALRRTREMGGGCSELPGLHLFTARADGIKFAAQRRARAAARSSATPVLGSARRTRWALRLPCCALRGSPAAPISAPPRRVSGHGTRPGRGAGGGEGTGTKAAGPALRRAGRRRVREAHEPPARRRREGPAPRGEHGAAGRAAGPRAGQARARRLLLLLAVFPLLLPLPALGSSALGQHGDGGGRAGYFT